MSRAHASPFVVCSHGRRSPGLGLSNSAPTGERRLCFGREDDVTDQMKRGLPFLETWREIPGFPDYEVSDEGRVRSWKEGRDGGHGPRILRQMVSPDGYRHLFLYRDGRMFKMRVHSAVLLAFVGPCPEGEECRHLDSDPSNNRLDNLAWGDRLDQWRDRRRQGRAPHGEHHPSHKLTEADVRKIRRLKQSASARELAGLFGVSHTTILAAVRGKRWSHVEGGNV